MSAATREGPPPSNRGANWTTDDLVWDWYQATLSAPGDVSSLMRALAAALRLPSEWVSGKGLYGYSAGYRLAGTEQGSVQVFLRPDDVHVQASSSAAVPVAEYLRRVWPEHRVSRADVALDTAEPGSFDRLWRHVHGLARNGSTGGGRKVSTSTAGDWIDGEQGRTLYAGGASSRARVVVYEKGREQIGKDPNCGADPNWTRVEWRLRPDTPEGKAWLGKATPAEAVGYTPFTATVAASLLAVDMTSMASVRRFASQDPAYWMARQYRRVLLGWLELDPDDMRDEIVALIDQTAPVAVT